jgi:hypothetical protein
MTLSRASGALPSVKHCNVVGLAMRVPTASHWSHQHASGRVP